MRKQNGTIDNFGGCPAMKVIFITLNETSMRLNSEFLTVETLSAILDQNQIENQIVSLEYQEVNNDICKPLNNIDWTKNKFVGITFTYETIEILKSIIKFIKNKNQDTHISFLYEVLPLLKASKKQVETSRITTNLIFGGENISKTVKDMFEEFPDLNSIILGEPEATITELVNDLISNKSINRCHGIAFRINDQISITPAREPILNLDDIPFAQRNYLRKTKGKTARILTSRGCSANCSFCAESRVYNVTKKWPKWRGRSPVNIVDEIEYLNKEYGIENFSMLDNSFEDPLLEGPDRLNDICEEILNRGLDIFFTVHMRAESIIKLDDSLFMKLKKAGLLRVCVGIESGYQHTLNLFKKIASVYDNINAIKKIQKCKIDYFTGFIMFHPYTTRDELWANLNFIKEAGIGHLNIFNTELWLYQNTPLYQKVERDDLLNKYNNSDNPIGYIFKDNNISNYYQLIKKYFNTTCLLQDGPLAIAKDIVYKKNKYGELPSLYSEINEYISNYIKALSVLQINLFESILTQEHEEQCYGLKEQIHDLDRKTHTDTKKFLIKEARYSLKH
jgi:radical SAM superfamily enzyme YgiQ (UPF0313 family)